MRNLFFLVIYLAALGVMSQFAVVFGIITLVTAWLVFSKIEADQNVYDLGFWFTRLPGQGLLFWFRAFGRIEAVIRSILLGFLAWFTFDGKDDSRQLESAWQLVAAVFFCYWFLAALVRKAHLNVLRWAFVKLSIVVGVIFSFLAVVFRDSRRSLLEQIDDFRPAWTRFGRERTLDEKVDQVHGVMNDATHVVHHKLESLIGEFGATVVMVLFNTQILHGFLVVLYTFVILLLTVPELRRRPEDATVR